jgi:hypothetical protein
MESKMVKKIKKTVKRDKGGRFKKGTGGGPGRKKGEPRDIICKDGKKRSVEALIDDLLSTYSKLGSDKFLHEWALKSHRNLTKFIDILFKFAPQPETLIKGEFKPLQVTVNRVITDKRPQELETYPRSHQGLEDQIHELRTELYAKDKRLKEYAALLDTLDIEDSVRSIPLIEHEPVKDKAKKDDDDDKSGSGGSDRTN